MEGFRQRCSDDEVLTHACYAHMLDPEEVAVDVNEDVEVQITLV